MQSANVPVSGDNTETTKCSLLEMGSFIQHAARHLSPPNGRLHLRPLFSRAPRVVGFLNFIVPVSKHARMRDVRNYIS
jgi:hypothetical protein